MSQLSEPNAKSAARHATGPEPQSAGREEFCAGEDGKLDVGTDPAVQPAALEFTNAVQDALQDWLEAHN